MLTRNVVFIVVFFIGASITQGALGELVSEKAGDAFAFYYQSDIPLEEANLYPAIVVQPSVIKPWQLKWLQERGTKVYAYLSVGEAVGNTQDVPSLANNENWNSVVADLTTDYWQSRLRREAMSLHAQFDGLFLDTLDGYMLAEEDKQQAQAAALIEIIKMLSAIFDGQMILNRGFPILSQVQGLAHTVVAEGLYSHYSPLTDSYKQTTKDDQAWLHLRLVDAKALGFDVQVLDYAIDKSLRQLFAKNIIADGYKAWVADGHLTQWGVSNLIPVPRKIRVFYNTDIIATSSIVKLDLHRKLSAYIEYLGYVPVYQDAATLSPRALDSALYAGIIVWTNDKKFYNTRLSQWLEGELGRTPMMLLGVLPVSKKIQQAFGIEPRASHSVLPITVSHVDDRIRSKAPMKWYGEDVTATQATSSHTSLLSIGDKITDDMPQIVSNSNGLIALTPWIIDTMPDTAERWLSDPMGLIKAGLNLPLIPAADVSTETGRRVLIAHIDGDGFPSKSYYPHGKYAAEVIRDEILEKYSIPTTVSIIEGEIASHGLYPELASTLETIAKQLFTFDYVEIASHSFSHPFYWPDQNDVIELSEEDTKYGYHLPIKDYQLDQVREIEGSINYINTKLTPPGKKVKVMLWTGEALVYSKALAGAKNKGVVSVNGGSTNVNLMPSIWPIGRYVDSGLYQIYAPAMNENEFTNGWTGPYGGFRQATKIFKITGEPLRLKPMNIYYHFYSGIYPASVNALKSVYDYAISTPHTSIYLSDYVKQAEDFYNTAIAQDHLGNWHVSGGSVKTLRIPRALGFPSLSANGIAGFDQYNDSYYTHLTQPVTQFSLINVAPKKPFIVNGNVIVNKWLVRGNAIELSFNAYLPGEILFENAKDCHFQEGSKRYALTRSGSLHQLLIGKGSHNGVLLCD